MIRVKSITFGEVTMERIKSLGVEQRAAVIVLTIAAICSIGLLLANCAVVG